MATKRARWRYFARQRLSVVPQKKIVVFHRHNKSFIDQACSARMIIDVGLVIFLRVYVSRLSLDS